MSKTLWAINEDMEALDALLEELGGDVTDEQVAATIEAWFAEIDSDLANKVDGYCALIRQLEAVAAARREEAERLTKRAKTGEANAKRLGERLKMFMAFRGMKKLDTPRYTVSVVNNGGAPPVEIDADAVLPDDLTRVIPEQREPDKKAIVAALQQGRELPGVRLGERGTRLAIR
jgi:hypothetical protein